MTILNELTERRARRAIAADPIPQESVARILEAATLAPSCFNNQPWRMVAVQGETLVDLRAALSENNAYAKRAPLIMVMATKPSLDCRLEGGRDYAQFDLGMAAMGLMLQATREGLIAHPIAGYSPAKAAKAVGLPEDFVVVTLIIVGLPGDDALLNDRQKEGERSARQRKPLGEVAFRDRYGEAFTPLDGPA